MTTAFSPLPLLALGLVLTASAQAQGVKLAKSYVGSDFENDFNFFTDDDPTHGYVNYVSKAVAQASNLITSTASSFRMAVDSTTAVATGRGRDSIRIVSKDEFGDGLYVLDVNHMPVGCGTWPAYWSTTTTGWPKGGEIDIIEGSNALPPTNSPSYASTFTSASQANLTGITLATSTTSSLHTIPECGLKEPLGLQSGTLESTVCDVSQNGNAGCGVELGSGSWGEGWNEGGGGLYVMWRDIKNSGRILIYTFPRASTTVPTSLLTSTSTTSQTIDPSTWNLTPQANFSIPSCPSKTFNNHVIVFNVALCGDLAANTFAGSGCAGTSGISCENFVKGSPGAFGEAYWDVRSLRVYNTDGKVPTNGSGLKSWQAAVIAVAAVLVAGLVVFVVVCSLLRKRRRNKSSSFAGGNGLNSSSRLSTLRQDSSHDLTPTSSHFPSNNNSKSNPNSIYGNPNTSSSSQVDQKDQNSPSYTSSTSYIPANNANALRRPSAPFVENTDGTNILRRGSASEAPLPQLRRPSAPFVLNDEDDAHSPRRSSNGGIPFGATVASSSANHSGAATPPRRMSVNPDPSGRRASPANSTKNGSSTSSPTMPVFGRSFNNSSDAQIKHLHSSLFSSSSNGGSFFTAPDRLAPVFARPPQDPNGPKPELKIGDGGKAFRHPDEALPGETPAVGSMSAFNSAGQSKRGSAASRATERDQRRGSASGGGGGGAEGIGEQAAAGAFSQNMVRNQGSRDSIGSHWSGGGAGGGGSGQGRKGSALSQAPVINNVSSTNHTSRRSSFGSVDGAGGRRKSSSGGGGSGSRSRRVSFGTDTNDGDGWDGGEGGVVDPWATEREEAPFEELDEGKGRTGSRR